MRRGKIYYLPKDYSFTIRSLLVKQEGKQKMIYWDIVPDGRWIEAL